MSTVLTLENARAFVSGLLRPGDTVAAYGWYCSCRHCVSITTARGVRYEVGLQDGELSASVLDTGGGGLIMAEVFCRREGCGKRWARDPVLEVACPSCQAGVGSPCRRPSEHQTWGGQPHAERDIAADKAGHYGPCPLGWCGLEQKAKREAFKAAPLFADPVNLHEPPSIEARRR
jgi:hypothetical protein